MLAQYVHSMTDRGEAEEALRRVGLGRAPEPSAEPALGRRAAAGVHRPGADQPAAADPRRRAHRQPRRGQRGDRDVAPRRPPPARAHADPGHPRPLDRRPRQPRDPAGARPAGPAGAARGRGAPGGARGALAAHRGGSAPASRSPGAAWPSCWPTACSPSPTARSPSPTAAAPRRRRRSGGCGSPRCCSRAPSPAARTRSAAGRRPSPPASRTRSAPSSTTPPSARTAGRSRPARTARSGRAAQLVLEVGAALEGLLPATSAAAMTSDQR